MLGGRKFARGAGAKSVKIAPRNRGLGPATNPPPPRHLLHL